MKLVDEESFVFANERRVCICMFAVTPQLNSQLGRSCVQILGEVLWDPSGELTGSIIGAFLGVVLMAMINNLLILTGVPVYYQGLVAGLVLIGAVGFDEYSKRRRGEIRS